MNSVKAGRVVLEPLTARHAAEMFAVLSDPKIYEFENAPPESVEWLARRFAKLEARVSPDGTQQWLNWVVRLPDGRLTGYVQATIEHDGTAHIAYELASEFWRRGIGGAAVSGMLRELAAAYGVTNCVATLKARNHRSLALLRSLDFERAGSGGIDELFMRKTIGNSDVDASPALRDRASFRAAVESDVPFLIELRRRTMTQHMIASGLEPSDDERRRRVADRFDCAQIILVAERSIGLLKVVRRGREWRLLQIQLLPEAQRTGLGTEIIGSVVAEARRAGASLELDVLRANPARRLYERLGFRVVSETPHAYEMRLESATTQPTA